MASAMVLPDCPSLCSCQIWIVILCNFSSLWTFLFTAFSRISLLAQAPSYPGMGSQDLQPLMALTCSHFGCLMALPC